MQFSLKVEGIKDVARDLENYSNRVRAGLLREVAKTTYGIHREAKENAPIGAEGTLKARIQASVVDLAGEAWSGAKHSLGVEMGQKPGTWPHVGDLMLWVKRKLRVPKNRLKSVTYLIGKKIFEKGTQAQPFFEPAVNKWRDKFYNNVNRLIRKA